MDKSKTYIQMCDCPEIQKPDGYNIRDLEKGDFYLASAKTIKHSDGLHREVNVFYRWSGMYTYIWIPRQDQLQEMIIDNYNFTSDMVDNFNSFLKNVVLVNIPNISSMEQLWLSFIMKEKFNKTWKDNKWQ